MTERFNPSGYLGEHVEIYATEFKQISTVHGPKQAAVADVYVGTGPDEVFFPNALVFNVGIVSDLKASKDMSVKGALTEVETKGRNDDGSPRKAIVVK